jgi:hypothetical protein
VEGARWVGGPLLAAVSISFAATHEIASPTAAITTAIPIGTLSNG